MPTTLSPNKRFVVPGASIGDNKLADIKATKNALLVIDSSLAALEQSLAQAQDAQNSSAQSISALSLSVASSVATLDGRIDSVAASVASSVAALHDEIAAAGGGSGGGSGSPDPQMQLAALAAATASADNDLQNQVNDIATAVAAVSADIQAGQLWTRQDTFQADSTEQLSILTPVFPTISEGGLGIDQILLERAEVVSQANAFKRNVGMTVDGVTLAPTVTPISMARMSASTVAATVKDGNNYAVALIPSSLDMNVATLEANSGTTLPLVVNSHVDIDATTSVFGTNTFQDEGLSGPTKLTVAGLKLLTPEEAGTDPDSGPGLVSSLKWQAVFAGPFHRTSPSMAVSYCTPTPDPQDLIHTVSADNGTNYFGKYKDNDTYILDPHLLEPWGYYAIVDNGGNNVVQLVPGLIINRGNFGTDGVVLQFANNVTVQIIIPPDQNKIKFQIAADARLGIDTPLLTYEEFASALGGMDEDDNMLWGVAVNKVVGYNQADAYNNIVQPVFNGSYDGGPAGTIIILDPRNALSGANIYLVDKSYDGARARGLANLVTGTVILSSTFGYSGCDLVLQHKSGGSVMYVHISSQYQDGWAFRLGGDARVGVFATDTSYVNFAAALGQPDVSGLTPGAPPSLSGTPSYEVRQYFDYVRAVAGTYNSPDTTNYIISNSIQPGATVTLQLSTGCNLIQFDPEISIAGRQFGSDMCILTLGNGAQVNIFGINDNTRFQLAANVSIDLTTEDLDYSKFARVLGVSVLPQDSSLASGTVPPVYYMTPTDHTYLVTGLQEELNGSSDPMGSRYVIDPSFHMYTAVTDTTGVNTIQIPHGLHIRGYEFAGCEDPDTLRNIGYGAVDLTLTISTTPRSLVTIRNASTFIYEIGGSYDSSTGQLVPGSTKSYSQFLAWLGLGRSISPMIFGQSLAYHTDIDLTQGNDVFNVSGGYAPSGHGVYRNFQPENGAALPVTIVLDQLLIEDNALMVISGTLQAGKLPVNGVIDDHPWIQLVPGMYITSSQFYADHCLLVLSNGAHIHITDINSRCYFSITRDTQDTKVLTYQKFAAALGAPVIPQDGTYASGTLNLDVTGIHASVTTATLSADLGHYTLINLELNTGEKLWTATVDLTDAMSYWGSSNCVLCVARSTGAPGEGTDSTIYVTLGDTVFEHDTITGQLLRTFNVQFPQGIARNNAMDGYTASFYDSQGHQLLLVGTFQSTSTYVGFAAIDLSETTTHVNTWLVESGPVSSFSYSVDGTLLFVDASETKLSIVKLSYNTGNPRADTTDIQIQDKLQLQLAMPPFEQYVDRITSATAMSNRVSVAVGSTVFTFNVSDFKGIVDQISTDKRWKITGLEVSVSTPQRFPATLLSNPTVTQPTVNMLPVLSDGLRFAAAGVPIDRAISTVGGSISAPPRPAVQIENLFAAGAFRMTNTGLPVPSDSHGGEFDVKGDVRVDKDYLYYCTADYGTADAIWVRAKLDSWGTPNVLQGTSTSGFGEGMVHPSAEGLVDPHQTVDPYLLWLNYPGALQLQFPGVFRLEVKIRAFPSTYSGWPAESFIYGSTLEGIYSADSNNGSNHYQSADVAALINAHPQNNQLTWTDVYELEIGESDTNTVFRILPFLTSDAVLPGHTITFDVRITATKIKSLGKKRMVVPAG